jgi:hypothetical protein
METMQIFGVIKTTNADMVYPEEHRMHHINRLASKLARKKCRKPSEPINPDSLGNLAVRRLMRELTGIGQRRNW